MRAILGSGTLFIGGLAILAANGVSENAGFLLVLLLCIASAALFLKLDR